MEHRTEEGDLLLKLWFSIVTHPNDARNKTINYIHNTDWGDKKYRPKKKRTKVHSA